MLKDRPTTKLNKNQEDQRQLFTASNKPPPTAERPSCHVIMLHTNLSLPTKWGSRGKIFARNMNTGHQKTEAEWCSVTELSSKQFLKFKSWCIICRVPHTFDSNYAVKTEKFPASVVLGCFSGALGIVLKALLSLNSPAPVFCLCTAWWGGNLVFL